jgi:hypothetical protein
MLIRILTALNLGKIRSALGEFLSFRRLKQLSYTNSLSRPYFWRTSTRIDYIEINADAVTAFEFKWSPTKKSKLPKSFSEAYNPSFLVVNKDNFRSF